MYQSLKRTLYFFVAWYFRIFAEIRLRLWHPRIIVVTGSSGKTTLLHLIESQLGDKAKFSHHANSSLGIPFDILGLKRKTLTFEEWPLLFLKAPFAVFTRLPKQRLYVVEADCDRPYEGDFLSSLLKPEITLWVSLSRTHSMNFERLVDGNKFKRVEEVIAHEFGFFIERTNEKVFIDGDDDNQLKEVGRTNASVEKINIGRDLKEYVISSKGSQFVFKDFTVRLPYLLPKEVGVSILMCLKLVKYLGEKVDLSFANFELPPARSSLFKGIKKITIVDSTYNANLSSMEAILNMYSKLISPNKWAVLGDMLEQGKYEEAEHKKLANLINKYSFERLILMGPRVKKFTLPYLKKKAVVFENPKDVLDYLNNNLMGGEVILFKGSRFLEGVIEHLLLNKEDAKKLSRREKVWEMRRKKWGL